MSSEPLQGENVWSELEETDIVAIDHRMRVVRARLGDDDLPTLGVDVEEGAKVRLDLVPRAVGS